MKTVGQIYKLNPETYPPHISDSLPDSITIIAEHFLSSTEQKFEFQASTGHYGVISSNALKAYYSLFDPAKDEQPKPVADEKQPRACVYDLLAHSLNIIEQWEAEDESDFGEEVSIKPGQLYIQKEEEICKETACAKAFIVKDVFKRPNGELLFTKTNCSDLVFYKAQYLASYELLEPVF